MESLDCWQQLALIDVFWKMDGVMSGPQPHAVAISAPQQALLHALLRQSSCPQALALRVQIVLGAAAGQRNHALAATLGCTLPTIRKWRQRWIAAQAPLAVAEDDPRALRQTIATVLADAPRSGSPGVFSAEQLIQIVNLACTPPRDSGRPIDAWTPRELADEAKRRAIVTAISPTTVGRFLKGGRFTAASESVLAECQNESR